MQNEKDSIFCTTKPPKTLQRTGFSAFNSLIENDDDTTKDLTKDTLRRVPSTCTWGFLWEWKLEVLPLLKPLSPFISSVYIACLSFLSAVRTLNINYSIVRIINAVLQTVHKRYPDLILVYRGDTMILTACYTEFIRSVHESQKPCWHSHCLDLSWEIIISV